MAYLVLFGFVAIALAAMSLLQGARFLVPNMTLLSKTLVTEGADYFVRSLTLNPWRPMCLIRWISTLPGAKFYRFSSKLIDQANRVVAEMRPSP
jgi:hypothetical protein